MKSKIVFLAALLSWAGLVARASVFEVRWVESKGSEKTTAFKFDKAGPLETLNLSNKVLLDRAAVSSARVVVEQVAVTSGPKPEKKPIPAIQLTFTRDGQKKFAELTKGSVGKQLGLVVDGKLVAAPVVKEAMPGGSVTLTGVFTKEEANALVGKIKAGK